jgi:hypothetical protein
MALAASGWNVGVVNWRIGMAGRENAVGRAVAVDTCSCRGRGAGVFCMHTVRIRILRGGVAIGASNFGRRILMHQAFYVFVAVDAAQQLAVDGVFELILVDKKAKRLAVFVSCERAIAMAGKTIGVLQLLGSMCAGTPSKKRRTKCTEQQKSNRSHAYEETLMQEKLP